MSSNTVKPDHLEQRAREAIDSVEQKTHETLEHAREKVEASVDRAQEIELGEAMQQMRTSVTHFIKEKPLQAAGIAFAAGMVTSMLLRRR